MSQYPPPPGVQFPTVNQSTPATAVAPQVVWANPPKKSFFRRLLGGFLTGVFILSLLLNFYLFLILGMQAQQAFETSTLADGNENQTIAVYPIRGVIDAKASQELAQFVQMVEKTPAIKAIVLRVESPGGTVSDSEQMYAMVKKLKDSKRKVVVSMGGLAASGGYYISAPADYVMAQHSTITGSIGVIMQWLVVKEGLSKLGIEPMTLKSTDAQYWKDELTPFDEPSARQRKHLQGVLDAMQTQFVQAVKEGRGSKIKPREVTYTNPASTAPGATSQPVSVTETEPFNGKIYMAQDALALGLIDGIGLQDAAIDKAKSLAQLSNPKVVQYERRKGFFERLAGAKSPGLNIDSKLMDDLQTPQFLMLWKVQ